MDWWDNTKTKGRKTWNFLKNTGRIVVQSAKETCQQMGTYTAETFQGLPQEHRQAKQALNDTSKQQLWVDTVTKCPTYRELAQALEKSNIDSNCYLPALKDIYLNKDTQKTKEQWITSLPSSFQLQGRALIGQLDTALAEPNQQQKQATKAVKTENKTINANAKNTVLDAEKNTSTYYYPTSLTADELTAITQKAKDDLVKKGIITDKRYWTAFYPDYNKMDPNGKVKFGFIDGYQNQMFENIDAAYVKQIRQAIAQNMQHEINNYCVRHYGWKTTAQGDVIVPPDTPCYQVQWQGVKSLFGDDAFGPTTLKVHKPTLASDLKTLPTAPLYNESLVPLSEGMNFQGNVNATSEFALSFVPGASGAIFTKDIANVVTDVHNIVKQNKLLAQEQNTLTAEKNDKMTPATDISKWAMLGSSALGISTVVLMQKCLVKKGEKGFWAGLKRWGIAPVLGIGAGLLTLGGVNAWLAKKVNNQPEKQTADTNKSAVPATSAPQQKAPCPSKTSSSAKVLNSFKEQPVTQNSQERQS